MAFGNHRVGAWSPGSDRSAGVRGRFKGPRLDVSDGFKKKLKMIRLGKTVGE